MNMEIFNQLRQLSQELPSRKISISMEELEGLFRLQAETDTSGDLPVLLDFRAQIENGSMTLATHYTVYEDKKDLKAGLEKFLLTRILYSQEVTDSPHFLKYKNINKNIQVIPNGVNLGSFDNVFCQKSDRNPHYLAPI